MKCHQHVIALGWAVLLCAASASAQTLTVSGAWVRGTVAGQSASGAFMELTSKNDATLLSVSSLVAGVVQVHEMKIEDGVMKMRMLPKLELPAGKTVQLKPGGYHIMLMDLKRPLNKGDTVPLLLKLEGKDKKVETVEVKAEVRDLTAAADGHDMSAHKH